MKKALNIFILLAIIVSCSNYKYFYFHKKPKGIAESNLKSVEDLNKSNCIEIGEVKEFGNICFCKNIQADKSYSIGIYQKYDSTQTNKMESGIDTVGIITQYTYFDVTLIPVFKPLGYIYFFDSTGNIINYKYYDVKKGNVPNNHFSK